MIDLGQIYEGHKNEILKRENELYEQRIKICKECALYTESVLGPICDSKKYVNIKTGQPNIFPCADCVNGCGCRLSAAARVIHKKCVLGKW